MPVVRLIVGDDNLSTDEARHALQQETDTDPLWKVIPAWEEGRGDHVAVNGATASFIPIPIGKSFGDRGMRPDQHDAVAVLLKIGDDSQPAEEETNSEADRGAYSRPNLDAETNMGDENSWRRMKQGGSETRRSNAIAEVSALVCQQKCVVERCRCFFVDKPSLIVAGMGHTHLCADHRDMRIEAQAARLENAIRDTRLREHLSDAAWNDDLCEAARIGSAASSGIGWTRTQGAALYAAVKAGQDAFKHGASSVEVVAAIHAAGAKTDDP